MHEPNLTFDKASPTTTVAGSNSSKRSFFFPQ